MIDFERQAAQEGYPFVVGIDEAGRGPLAGPVVASAVILHSKEFTHKIADSKKLTPRQRTKAYEEIQAKALVGTGIISETVIDEQNILRATFYAMANAVRALMAKVAERSPVETNKTLLLIDGNRFETDLPYAFRTIVNGDRLCLSIACASIIAKVTRDRILDQYDKIFPEYGFKQHKGYPTKAHRDAIRKFGLSMVHRKSFHVKA